MDEFVEFAAVEAAKALAAARKRAAAAAAAKAGRVDAAPPSPIVVAVPAARPVQPVQNPPPTDPFAIDASLAPRPAARPAVTSAARLLAAFSGPNALLAGIVFSEVLGPPVSLREGPPKRSS